MCILINPLAGGWWLEGQVWKYCCLLLIEFDTSGSQTQSDGWDSCRQVGAEQQQPLPICLSRLPPEATHCLVQPEAVDHCKDSDGLSQTTWRRIPFSLNRYVFTSMWLGRSHQKAIALCLCAGNRLAYSEKQPRDCWTISSTLCSLKLELIVSSICIQHLNLLIKL